MGPTYGNAFVFPRDVVCPDADCYYRIMIWGMEKCRSVNVNGNGCFSRSESDDGDTDSGSGSESESDAEGEEADNPWISLGTEPNKAKAKHGKQDKVQQVKNGVWIANPRDAAVYIAWLIDGSKPRPRAGIV